MCFNPRITHKQYNSDLSSVFCWDSNLLVLSKGFVLIVKKKFKWSALQVHSETTEMNCNVTFSGLVLSS